MGPARWMVDLSRSMVQILGLGGEVAGAGFLVTSDLVLTTAQAVLDPGAQQRPEVSFELIPAGGVMAATTTNGPAEPPQLPRRLSLMVVFAHRQARPVPATVLPPDGGDPPGLILLRVRRPPKDAQPLPLADHPPQDDDVQLAGFARRPGGQRDSPVQVITGRLGASDFPLAAGGFGAVASVGGPAAESEPGYGTGRLLRIDEIGDTSDLFLGGPVLDGGGSVIGVITGHQPGRAGAGRAGTALAQPILGLAQALPLVTSAGSGLARRVRHRHLLMGTAAAAVTVMAAGALVVLRPVAGQHDARLSQTLAADSRHLPDGADLKPLLAATALSYAGTPEALTAARDLLATPSAALFGHSGTVNGLSFSPDGRVLASAGSDGTTRLWSISAHRELGLPFMDEGPLQEVITAVAFNPAGTLLATSQFSGRIRIRDAGNRSPVGSPLGVTAGQGQSNDVLAMTFSPDGKTLAASGYGGMIRFWDVASQHPSGPPMSDRSYVSVPSIAYSPDGRLLVTLTSDGRVRLWDARTRTTVGSLATGKALTLSIAFSPDGKTLFTGDSQGTTTLWDVATRRPAAVWQDDRGPVRAVSVSPDGLTIAIGHDDGSVELWNSGGGPPYSPALDGGTDRVVALRFSPDGKSLAAAGVSGLVRVWDVSHANDYQRLGPDPDSRAQLISGLCVMAGRPISRDEWQQQLPDEPYRNVCPSLPSRPAQ